MADAAQADVLQQFLSITGSDEGVALSVLESTSWVLEDAVNLFFATGGEGLGGGGGGAAGGAGAAAGGGASGAAAGGGSGGGGAGGGGSGGGGVIGPEDYADEVRAPDPTKRERLYGDAHGIPAPHHGYGAAAGRFGAAGAAAAADPGYVDAFRDFEAEARRAGASGSGGGAQPATGGTPPGAAGGLSELFKPPERILFKGPFEAAKQAALQQSRWLLVNVQSSSEFASHRLNRDTWSEGLVQDMLTGTFVFWQAYDTTPQGQHVINAYHLGALPAILIIDPITGSQLLHRTGFVAAETLIEELVPFMDAGPADPAASQLAQQAAASLAGKRKAGGAAASGPRAEDEELALALAMSAEEAGVGGSGAVPMEEEDEEEEERRIYAQIEEMRAREAAAAAASAAAGGGAAAAPPQRQQPAAGGASSREAGAPAAVTAAAPAAAPVAAPVVAAAPGPHPAEVQAAAAARLPPEPADGDAGALRVGVRLPEGNRAQRRFAKADTVAALNDWVASLSPQAAVRPFALSQMGPGAPVLADAAASLESAGVAGAMLVVRWED